MAAGGALVLPKWPCPCSGSLVTDKHCFRTPQDRSRVSLPALASAGSDENRSTGERDKTTRLLSRRLAAVILPIAVATAGSIVNSPASANSSTSAASDGGPGRVELRTLNGCGLGVARYPDFLYNATGGGGSGEARTLPEGATHVRFDATRLYIPAVDFDTTSILGLPLPPGLKIEVVPQILEGYVDQRTGKVELNFLANFYFTAWSIYQAQPLVVDTKLTTETARGVFRSGEGRRLDSSGNVKLVGVARLAPVDDVFLSTFLTLPTDCLAELSANLSFSQ